jgi:hypothetical protein
MPNTINHNTAQYSQTPLRDISFRFRLAGKLELTRSNGHSDSAAARTLTVPMGVVAPLTPQKCLDACQAQGYLYSGLEYSVVRPFIQPHPLLIPLIPSSVYLPPDVPDI